jgi:hypothetical protein
MSTRTLVIIVIVLVLLAIVSTVVGATRPAPKHTDPVDQQKDIAADGTGSSLEGPASWFDWAQPDFPLTQLTVGATLTQRTFVLPPAGMVAITVAKITGTTVRKLTLALEKTPSAASPVLAYVTYHLNGALPTGVKASTLPPDHQTADSPTLPRTVAPPAATPDGTCSLAIYPGGALVTVHSRSAQALTLEIR